LLLLSAVANTQENTSPFVYPTTGSKRRAGEQQLFGEWYPSQSFVTLATEFCYNYSVWFCSRMAFPSGAESGAF
jgi:hypothetical protein